MDNNTNNALQQWLENRERLMAIDSTTTDVLYNEAIELCKKIGTTLAQETDKDDYIAFLSAYANLLAIREENLNTELQVQEEIIAIRRSQAEENKELYLPKLSNSLLYASMLHRKAANIHRAIEYMEECVACEKEALEEFAASTTYQLALKQYYLANTYSATGRNILAEELYKESIAMFMVAMKEHATNQEEVRLILSQILVEMGDFYYNSRMVDSAIDRYLQAIELLQAAPQTTPIVDASKALHIMLSEIYKQLGNDEKSNYYASMA